jgi:hypothetical protein
VARHSWSREQPLNKRDGAKKAVHTRERMSGRTFISKDFSFVSSKRMEMLSIFVDEVGI